MEGEDFRPLADEAPLKPVFRSLPKSPLLGRAMKSDRRMFAWIYHELTPYGDQQPETVEHAVMNIGGLRPGKYRVEFWDTYKGEKISAMDLDYPPDKSGVEIKLPPVARDIAMKIKPVP